MAALTVGLYALIELGAVDAAHAHGGVDPAGALPLPGSNVGARSDGPLSAADKDLLVKVRLAGLWEEPAGKMAAEKGSAPRVREIGAMIGSQHRQLDALVVKAAQEVGVELPDQPNADQQRWLNEMEVASGAQFDQVFVDRLRVAHGKVFPVIAEVRAGTQNSVVRRLAQSANGYVLMHLTLLESTGLVDYGALATGKESPTVTAASAGNGSEPGGLSRAVAWIFTSPPSYPGMIISIVVLLIVPRLVRSYVRKRFTPRPAAGFRRPPRPGGSLGRPSPYADLFDGPPTRRLRTDPGLRSESVRSESVRSEYERSAL